MRRSSLLGAGVGASAVASTILILAGSATAAGSVHTLHLRTTRLQLTEPTVSTFVQSDVVRRAGKKVGYENLSCNDGGTNVKCSLSIALPGGMLLGAVTTPISTSDKTTYTGKVTGGLGSYSGVSGTIKAQVSGRHATYTISYS